MIKMDMDKEMLERLKGATLTNVETKVEDRSLDYTLLFKLEDNSEVEVHGKGPLETFQTAKCLDCGKPLEVNHEGKCPKCGSIRKEIATQVFLTMGMKVNAGYKSEENSNTINLPLLLLLFIITFLGATVGLITGIYGYLVSICVSLLFSLITSALGYYAIIKTKTIKEWNMPN